MPHPDDMASSAQTSRSQDRNIRERLMLAAILFAGVFACIFIYAVSTGMEIERTSALATEISSLPTPTPPYTPGEADVPEIVEYRKVLEEHQAPEIPDPVNIQVLVLFGMLFIGIVLVFLPRAAKYLSSGRKDDAH